MGISQFNWLQNVIDFLYEFFWKYIYLFIQLVGYNSKINFYGTKWENFCLVAWLSTQAELRGRLFEELDLVILLSSNQAMNNE